LTPFEVWTTMLDPVVDKAEEEATGSGADNVLPETRLVQMKIL
jgi:hypothetical protein